jgi:hypothetical protein
MKTRIRFLLLLLILAGCFPLLCQAQSGLRIASIFERYGKQKGVAMVELSTEMLETYGMDKYKSITIKDAHRALPEIRQSLEVDKRGAKKIKEIIQGGQLVSGYYQLPSRKEDQNRFILFKLSKKGSATLVYIEGELESDDLITMLFMKKD